MVDLFHDVRTFHQKFELEHHPRVAPKLPDEDLLRFRFRFLEEELAEFAVAMGERDLAKAADALVDLVYVALGTAHFMGLDFNAHWAEVQRANLAKERATGGDDPRSKRRHTLDVVKPEGWLPPDHEPILARTRVDHGYLDGAID